MTVLEKATGGAILYVDYGDSGMFPVPSVKFDIYSTNGMDSRSMTMVNLADGGWHHVVVTKDHTEQVTVVYIDGQYTGSGSGFQYSDIYSSNNPILVGAVWVTPSNPPAGNEFDGLIDDLQLFGCVLTPAQVSQIYNQQVGNWLAVSSDNSQGVGIYNSNTGAAVNTTSITGIGTQLNVEFGDGCLYLLSPLSSSGNWDVARYPFGNWSPKEVFASLPNIPDYGMVVGPDGYVYMGAQNGSFSERATAGEVSKPCPRRRMAATEKCVWVRITSSTG